VKGPIAIRLKYDPEPMRIPFKIPGSEGRAFDVVGLGENSVDYVASIAGHPVANSKHPMRQFACLPGGQTATALVACARLGWRTSYIGAFGDDAAGCLSRESLVAAGVDVAASRLVPGATNRVAIILVDAATGARTVIWHRDPTLRLGDLSTRAAVAGRVLLVDCDDLIAAEKACRIARDAGVPSIADVEGVQAGVELLLRSVDVIIAAEEFPAALTGFADHGRALAAIEKEYGPRLVCMTLGAEGSLARCAGREIRTPAFDVECVDSTGAGDVFRGAFASGCLRWPAGDLETVLGYANAAGALACRGFGARGRLPTEAELDRLVHDRTSP
jgi:sulfofructose kinase